MVTTTTRTDPKELLKDASDVATATLDHARSFGDTASAVADQAGQMMGSATEAAQQFGKQAQDLAGEAYRRGEGAARQIGQSVEEQPLIAVAIAFGVGYLVSYLMHGR